MEVGISAVEAYSAGPPFRIVAVPFTLITAVPRSSKAVSADWGRPETIVGRGVQEDGDGHKEDNHSQHHEHFFDRRRGKNIRK